MPDGPAAQIHEGLRLLQEDFLGIVVKLGHLRIEAVLEAAHAGPGRQRIDHGVTDIVAGAFVAFARVAQTDHQLHGIPRAPRAAERVRLTIR